MHKKFILLLEFVMQENMRFYNGPVITPFLLLPFRQYLKFPACTVGRQLQLVFGTSLRWLGHIRRQNGSE